MDPLSNAEVAEFWEFLAERGVNVDQAEIGIQDIVDAVDVRGEPPMPFPEEFLNPLAGMMP